MAAFASAGVPRAQFHISLKRPEPVPVPAESVSHFEELLAKVLKHHWEDEVNECSAWIQQYAAHSESRLTACIRYFAARAEEARFPNASQAFVSSSSLPYKQCTALLYLVNDLLHRIKFHGTDQQQYVLPTIRPALMSLIDNSTKNLTQKKFLGYYMQLAEIVKLWESIKYFDLNTADEMKQEIETNMHTARAAWYLPEWNGNPSKPWFEQPQSLWCRLLGRTYITDDPTLTVNDLVPAHNGKKTVEVSNTTHTAVGEFCADPYGWEKLRALKKFDSQDRRVVRDELSQIGIKDDETEAVVETQDYYGFDYRIEKMVESFHRVLSDIDPAPGGVLRSSPMPKGECLKCNPAGSLTVE